MNIISAKNARKESTVTPTITMVTEEELDAAIKKASSMGKTQILVRKESLSNSMKRALESLGNRYELV